MKNKVKLKWKIIIGLICIIMITIVINFIPTWRLRVSDMHELNGSWINVYYENEIEAAKDVFSYADSETEAIAEKLGFKEKQNINVYIYDHQNTMQTKKYGYIAPLLGLEWYIGDNIGTNVLLTSPANPGPVHDYETNKHAVLHEIVHAYVSVINKDVDLWLTEGMALYLSNGEPFYRDQLFDYKVPSFEDICSNNPITFSNCGGYMLAHTYIEYLDQEYGWDQVLELVRTENYEDTLRKSRNDIYEEWVHYIKNYYQ